MLGKIKDIMKLQAQAKQIKKELANIHIEAVEEQVTVTVNGEMEMVSVILAPGTMMPGNETRLGNMLVKATNKAIKKAQLIAAEKMKGMMGDMQGLMGGGEG